MNVIALFCLVVVMLAIFSLVYALVFTHTLRKRYKDLYKELQMLRAIVHDLSAFAVGIPANTKLYWDVPSGTGCLRCGEGEIYRRQRYRLISADGENVALQKLVGVCWCGSCGYRGLTVPGA